MCQEALQWVSTDLVFSSGDNLFQQILNAECQVAITTWVWVVCKAGGGISANLEVNKKNMFLCTVISEQWVKHQCLKMMEPSEYKERNVVEGNFIRNIKVDVRRQDSTQKMMSLGKNNDIHCVEFPFKNTCLLCVAVLILIWFVPIGAQERIIFVYSFGLSLSASETKSLIYSHSYFSALKTWSIIHHS